MLNAAFHFLNSRQLEHYSLFLGTRELKVSLIHAIGKYVGHSNLNGRANESLTTYLLHEEFANGDDNYHVQRAILQVLNNQVS
jgi:hypothetical protein